MRAGGPGGDRPGPKSLSGDGDDAPPPEAEETDWADLLMRACREPFNETVESVRRLTPGQLVQLLTGAKHDPSPGSYRPAEGEDLAEVVRRRRAAWRAFADPDFEAQ